MIVHGKIVDAGPQGLTIHIPYHPNFVTQQWDEVAVDIPDGRYISPEQNRKAHALMADIANHIGLTQKEAKTTLKHGFMEKHVDRLFEEMLSLASNKCDMTTARHFITYLIEVALEFDVPLSEPLVSLCDDIDKAVYSCLMHRKCIICGKPCDLHHVDRVGMGGDRHDMCHIGMEALPLCREHHREAHDHGDKALMDKYHLEPVIIDKEIAKVYRLGRASKNE